MRSIYSATGSLVLGALLATPPQAAFGQAGVKAELRFDARPGTEISANELDEFIGKSLSVVFGTDMRPLSVKLHTELISRREGVVAEHESEAVEIESGGTHRGSKWLPYWKGTIAPGFGDRRKIGFLGFGVWDRIEEVWTDRACEGASHALRIDVGQGDGVLVKNGQPMICLKVEG
jgi:hypothetical protein